MHKDGASAPGRFRRARLRPMVCLAWARQGCPQSTKALRAGGSVCGSTVDQHKPARDLALKDCAPRIVCRKSVSGFDDDSPPDTKPSQGIVLSDFWTGAIGRAGVLDTTLAGNAFLNRDPTVAVAAGHKAIGDQGDGDAGTLSKTGNLDNDLVGTGSANRVIFE